MVIDIVNYTSEQLAVLSTGCLQKILTAQEKKNELIEKMNETLAKEKLVYIQNGTYGSEYMKKRTKELQAECDAEIAKLRDSLIFYLQYVSTVKGEGHIPDDVPYYVNFSYSLEERMEVVKEYYEDTYTSPTVRYAKLSVDDFAKSYLCDMYAPLLQYFKEQL